MADEEKHLEKTCEKKLCDSSTKLPCEPGSSVTESKEHLPENVLNLKKLSMEQMVKIAEVQALENELEDQLQRKHQEELREHMLRQKKEILELEKQLKLKITNGSLAIEEGTGINMPFSSSDQIIACPPALPEIIEGDVECKELIGDVSSSPKLSNLVAEDSKSDAGGSNDGKLIPNEQDITRELLDLSLNDSDEEFPFSASSLQLMKEDVHSWQSVDGNIPLNQNQKRPLSELQNRQFVSHRRPQNNRRSNMDLYKTEVCRTWTVLGHCPYGERCRFAHGMRELRKRPARHRNFKRVNCKNFSEGYCQYNSRCRFSHDMSAQSMLGRPRYMLPRRNQTPNWRGGYGYDLRDYLDYAPSIPSGMFMNRQWGRPGMAYPPRQY